MAGTFKYKVDSSAVPGIAALQTKLNVFGGQGWELVIADDSGLLVLKDSSPQKFSYKVDNPPVVVQPQDFENYLNQLGTAGWELATVSVLTNTVIFKKTL